jgi:hypothetical protein
MRLKNKKTARIRILKSSKEYKIFSITYSVSLEIHVCKKFHKNTINLILLYQKENLYGKTNTKA